MNIAAHHSMMAGKRLPYDAEVEYLESTGTQWIDSGAKVYSDSNAELGVELLSTSEIAFFGSSTSTDRFVLRSLSGNLSFGYGSWWQNLSASLMGSTMHVLATSQNYGQAASSIICDGVSYSGNAAAAKSGTDTFQIFNCFRNNMGACRIYYCKIYRGSNVVFDGIPVRKGAVGYLYDRVSGELFRNAGTGAFVIGPDVN